MGLFHEAVPTGLFLIGRHMVGQIIAARACDVFVLEATNAVELRLVHPVEQGLEFGLCLAPVSYTHLDVYKRQQLR